MREDSRNKSENDWCWGRGFVLGAREEKSVAYGNKVMDTRLPQLAGFGDKYDVSGCGFGRLLSAFCMFFKYPSPDTFVSPSPSRGEGYGLLRRCTSRNDAERTNIIFKGLDVVRQYAALLERRVQRGTRARKALVVTRQANPLGRSMIEMLGVLAIVGVLSVGGIAGYSKAMEMYKINKTVSEYNYLIAGLLEHLDSQRTKGYTYNQVLDALNLIPQSWKRNADSFLDNLGNRVNVFSFADSNNIRIDIYLGGIAEASGGSRSAPGFNHRVCTALIRQLVQPLHASISGFAFYRSNGTWESFTGDSSCRPQVKCLSRMTLSEIETECKTCLKNEQACALVLDF